MTETWPVVCATAHRQFDPSAEHWVREKLTAGAIWLRDHRGMRVGISGMALCGDQWWARAVLDAELELHAYIPYRSQSDRWSPLEQTEWRRLLGLASFVKPPPSNPPNRREAVRLLHARNDAMLAASSAVIAALRADATEGGTLSAVRKAQRLGLPGVHLAPAGRKVRVVEPGGWF